MIPIFITMHRKSTTRPDRPMARIAPRGIGPILDPGPNDVLCGRGGRVNAHEGNVQFRRIVASQKQKYLAKTTRKLEKCHIAAVVVETIRKMDPPGRFLKADLGSGLWFDIGDVNAIRKAGQALRENALDIRQDQAEDAKNDEASPKKVSTKASKTTPTASGACFTNDKATLRDIQTSGRDGRSLSLSEKSRHRCGSSSSKQQPPDYTSSLGSFPVTVSIVSVEKPTTSNLSLISPEQGSDRIKAEDLGD